MREQRKTWTRTKTRTRTQTQTQIRTHPDVDLALGLDVDVDANVDVEEDALRQLALRNRFRHVRLSDPQYTLHADSPDQIREILTTVQGEDDPSYRENVLSTWL
jgi:hypothetical protein